MRLKNRVRQTREALGLSRNRLAKATGISYPTLTDLEHGRREPVAEIRQKLADFFGDPYLFWLEGQEAALAGVS